jgi:hypothetical protein
LSPTPGTGEHQVGLRQSVPPERRVSALVPSTSHAGGPATGVSAELHAEAGLQRAAGLQVLGDAAAGEPAAEVCPGLVGHRAHLDDGAQHRSSAGYRC